MTITSVISIFDRTALLLFYGLVVLGLPAAAAIVVG